MEERVVGGEENTSRQSTHHRAATERLTSASSMLEIPVSLVSITPQAGQEGDKHFIALWSVQKFSQNSVNCFLTFWMLSFLRNLSGKEVTHGVDEQFLVKPSLWEWFSLGGLESWNRAGLIVSLWEILSPSRSSVSSPVFHSQAPWYQLKNYIQIHVQWLWLGFCLLRKVRKNNTEKATRRAAEKYSDFFLFDI